MKPLMVILTLALSLSAAADPKKDAEMLSSWFEAGSKAASAEQMSKVYADNAVLLPPNMAAVTGRENIVKYWSGMVQGGPVDLDLIMEDFMVDGDLAVDRGRYEITAPFKDSGKYVVVLRKQASGDWRIVTDIFNPSTPAEK